MQDSDFILNIRQTATRLSELDLRFSVFGAEKHRYQFAKPLSLAEVDEFEQANQVTLPAAYKRYLTELGNGGAGPYYGIEPLSNDARILNTIRLAQYGCGIEVLLVIRGPCAGELWCNAPDEGGIQVMKKEGQPVKFEDFCCSILNSNLERFETVHELMQKGIEHDAIHELLDESFWALEIDQAMLSIMDCDENERATVARDKAFGAVCGLVDDYYPQWCSENCK